jgi:ATP-binding cassette subfamily F protein 3
LISPNGRGKSTLLKQIATGIIKIPDTMSCLYVEQEVVAEEVTVFNTVLNSNTKRTKLIEKYEQL